MDEKWRIVEEFPTYKVSNYGDVLNHASGRVLKQSQTKAGLVKVGLVSGGVQYTRSVAVLVAEAFVLGRSDIFNTPIHMDGDQTNNRADNLMWRPRWFAWKYFRQFDEPRRGNRAIVDIHSGREYKNLFEAATTHGLLTQDIAKAISLKAPVFPTKQYFVHK